MRLGMAIARPARLSPIHPALTQFPEPGVGGTGAPGVAAI
jgi:hypothetical protein